MDLTRGKLAPLLGALGDIPQWNSFSIGRVREAARPGLPTTGHSVSHSVEEIREHLETFDTSHILMLDDTSFSGTTSLLVEDLFQRALPEKKIQFTHGFLIVNTGMLGESEGAFDRLQQNGSEVVSGFEMRTPRDDGWHFFDIVDQASIEEHLLVVKELLRLLTLPQSERLTASFLQNQEVLTTLFPQLVPADELRDQQRSGRFLAKKEIPDGLHVRNPQLLPNIIEQNHLLSPAEWRARSDEVFALLLHINSLLQKGVK